MTNYEYWKDELLKMWKSGNNFGVVDDTPQPCTAIPCGPCGKCAFWGMTNISSCALCRKEWLNDTHVKYQTDWSKVPIDTPIKVRNNNKVFSRHYAGLNKCGLPTFYANGRTSYTNSIDPCDVYDEIMLASESDTFKYRKEFE